MGFVPPKKISLGGPDNYLNIFVFLFHKLIKQIVQGEGQAHYYTDD